MKKILLSIIMMLSTGCAFSQGTLYSGHFQGNGGPGTPTGAGLTNIPPTGLQNNGGTASSSTFYRGDGQWQVPAGGGGSGIPTLNGTGTNTTLITPTFSGTTSHTNFTLFVDTHENEHIQNGQSFYRSFYFGGNQNFYEHVFGNSWQFWNAIVGYDWLFVNTTGAIQFQDNGQGMTLDGQTVLTNAVTNVVVTNLNGTSNGIAASIVGATLNITHTANTNVGTGTVTSVTADGTFATGTVTTSGSFTPVAAPTFNGTNATNLTVANLSTNGATNGMVIEFNGTNWVPVTNINANLVGNGSGLTNLQATNVVGIITNQVAASNITSGGTIITNALPGLLPGLSQSNGVNLTNVTAAFQNAISTSLPMSANLMITGTNFVTSNSVEYTWQSQLEISSTNVTVCLSNSFINLGALAGTNTTTSLLVQRIGFSSQTGLIDAYTYNAPRIEWTNGPTAGLKGGSSGVLTNIGYFGTAGNNSPTSYQPTIANSSTGWSVSFSMTNAVKTLFTARGTLWTYYTP